MGENGHDIRVCNATDLHSYSGGNTYILIWRIYITRNIDKSING